MKSLPLLSIICILIIASITTNYAQQETTPFTLETPSGKTINAEKGLLEVPESRANPASEKINIFFIRLKSTSPEAKAPIFYLAGGPGNSASWQIKNDLYLENWAAFLEDRDVILIDQRGTGKSSKRLLWINQEIPPTDVFVTERAANLYFEAMSKKAVDAFEERGVDLNGYNTIENAKDLEALRTKLAYPKITLLGFSYGTHLGLTYMKLFEDKVDQAILAGVEGLDETFKLPLDLDQSFKQIAAMVKADAGINEDIRDLVALYKKVSNQLANAPITVEIISPLTKQTMPVKIGKFGLDYILRRDMSDATDIPVFPKLLYTIDQGDYSVLQWFVQKRIKDIIGIPAMLFSMDIASGLSPERLGKIQEQEKQSLFGGVANAPFLTLRNKWPVTDLGTEFRKSIQTNIPTLFLSGSLDSNTPAYQAQAAQKGFSNAYHLVVENAGHEQILMHRETTKAILAFLGGADVSDRKITFPPLTFIPVKSEVAEKGHPSLAN